jgi:hypothetical protein
MLPSNYFVAMLVILVLSLAFAASGIIMDNQAMLICGASVFTFTVGVSLFVGRRLFGYIRSPPIETTNPVPVSSSMMKRNKSDTDLQLIQAETA